MGDWLTGEDSDDRKADTVDGVEDQSVLDKTASHLAWEDPEKEEKKCGFEKHNLQVVKNLQCVHRLYEGREFWEWNCPDITT